MKQAHSWLRNYFINAAIGKKWPLENRNRGRVKYNIGIYFSIIKYKQAIIHGYSG